MFARDSGVSSRKNSASSSVAARPLIRVRHDYGDRAVLLDVWRVETWQGQISGREGQDLRWVAAGALTDLAMPAADGPIVTAVTLPDRYLITPAPGNDEDAFLDTLGRSIDAGVELVALRAKALGDDELARLARRTAAVCRARGARLMVNASAELLEACDADGVHLDSTRLMACESRPLPASALLAASCHNEREIDHAARVGVDFAVLSPVATTRSHPHASPMGWTAFQRLVEMVNLPVYALGGMGEDDRFAAWTHGGQGIAAIGALWKSSDQSRGPRQD